MPLICEPLEPHESPVTLLWDWTFGESLLPFRPAIEAAAGVMAGRLTSNVPLPAVPETVAFTEWGPVLNPDTPADTLRVYVGPVGGDGVLGASGPASSLTQLPRSGAASLGLNPAVDWSRYSLPTVVRHELLHAVGVVGHSGDPSALMAAQLSAGSVRDARPADVSLASQYGWEVGPPADLLHGAAVESPLGFGGWMRLPPEWAVGWWRAGNL